MAERKQQMGVSRSAAILTAGAMIEFALQFLVPVILVRNLDADQFGQYRLLTLVLVTALALAPAFMPQSLYYFLPAASDERRRLVIGNVLLYLAIMGVIVALVASPANAAGGSLLHALFRDTHGVSSVVLGLSVLLSITTTLAIAEGRIMWHFWTDLCLALVRAALIALAAIATGKIAWVVAALALDTILRCAVAIGYLATRPGGIRIGVRPPLLLAQLRYSLPFALGTSLYALRVQGDQWVAATMLPAAAFAAFTIGAVVLPVASLIRHPINSAILPKLSAEFAEGRLDRVHLLLVKGSSAATLILMPMAGTLFVLAPEIVALVYTDKYLAAIPVMRAYLVWIMMQSFAIGYAMPILNLAKVAVRINGAGLLLSVGCSIAGAWCFGLAGAALGSIVAFAACEIASMRAIAAVLGKSFVDMLPVRLMVITATAAGAGLFVTVLVDAHPAGGLWGAAALKLGLYGSIVAAVFAIGGGIAEIQRVRSRA